MSLPREWIGALLVMAALARAALLVGHEPLVGYANQYDMLRTSACLGLYPALPEAQRYGATPEAPVAIFTRADRKPEFCYRSTESALDGAVARLAHHFDADRDGVPLRWFGWAKLALMGLAALALTFALHRRPLAALLHGLVCFAVLADPVAVLWYNSFYTEFGTIWGLYGAVGALCALAVGGRGAFALSAVLTAALAALAFSREQYALIGPVLVAVSWPWLWRRSPHAAVSAFGVALVASLFAFGLMPRPQGVAASNRVDTYLGVVLPAATDGDRDLALLGLPPRCGNVVGTTWYLRHGEKLEEECPEVMRLSSLAFVRLVGHDPLALARSVARVLPATQAITPGYLGVLAGRPNTEVDALPWWLRSPLDAVHRALPGSVYAVLILGVLAAAPLALAGAAIWARPARGAPGVGFLLAMLLAIVVAYAMATTVFGDGMSEAARHFLAGNLALWCAWIALAVGIPELAFRWARAPRDRAWEIVAALGACVLVAYACHATLAWARRQPLGSGVLETPQTRVVRPNESLRMAGWALDPFGIEHLELVAGPVRRTFTADIPSFDIRRVLPGYPDSPRARFRAELSAAELAQAGAPNPVTLLLHVKSRAGPTTEIDRRRLEFAP